MRSPSASEPPSTRRGRRIITFQSIMPSRRWLWPPAPPAVRCGVLFALALRFDAEHFAPLAAARPSPEWGTPGDASHPPHPPPHPQKGTVCPRGLFQTDAVGEHPLGVTPG